MPRFLQLPALLLLTVFTPGLARAADVTVEKNVDRVTVKIDGQPFTEYVTLSGSKPILWPIIGPSGKPLTRAFPMEKGRPGEEADHPWHRSLWFTHGKVNGVDFWSEAQAGKPDKFGKIQHREFLKVEGGPQATIVSINDWVAPDGVKLLEDQRTILLGVDGKNRFIDFDIVLKATEKDIDFGDTKEGSFGVRVASPMRVEAKGGGKIVNSVGQTDDDAWGKRAAWVDYQGPVDGQTVGIAIMNHPTSYGFPTPWHVRTYGLFAANPFGRKDFKIEGPGGHKLKKDESIALKYRVLLHDGDAAAAHVAEAYDAYSKLDKKESVTP
jgi:hypothetical protein